MDFEAWCYWLWWPQNSKRCLRQCASQSMFLPPPPSRRHREGSLEIRSLLSQDHHYLPLDGFHASLGFGSENLTSCDGQHPLLCTLKPQGLCFLWPLLTRPNSPFLSQGDYVWPGL